MLYSNQTPETTTQKDPDFYQGNNFLLGLLGYKNNGEQSTWGKALTFGAQAALGPVLGTLASKGINAVAKNQLGGAEDSLANLEQTDDKIGAAGSATSGIIQSLLPMLGGGGVPGVGSILSLLGGIGKKGGGTAAPATPAFRTGGEVSFRVGGVTVKMPKPDYKVYDDKDKAEDLLMIDIATGRPYGKMRYGERIFDQKSNLAMKYVMQSTKTETEKKQALGEHVYDELLTHSDIKGFATGGETNHLPGGLWLIGASKSPYTSILDSLVRFADGGPVPAGATNISTASQDNARKLRMQRNQSNTAAEDARLAELELILRTEKDPTARARIQTQVNAMRQAKAANVATPPVPSSGINPGSQLAEIEERLRTAKPGSTEESFYKDQVQRLRGAGVQTPLQSGYSNWLNNGIAMNWALNAANPPAPVNTNPGQSDTSKIPPPNTTGGSSNSIGGRTAIPQPRPAATPLSRYTSDIYTVVPGDTLSGIEKMTGIPRYQMLDNNRELIANPDKIDVGQVLRLRPEPYKPAAPMSEIDTRRVGGKEVQAGNMYTMGKPAIPNRAITPIPGTPETTAGNSLGWGDVMDIGRIMAGVAIAKKPISPWEPSMLFTNWQREVEARKNQGLSPEVLAQGNQNISGTYRAGVDTLTQSVGGGANPGVVLAGLTNLSGQRQGQLSQLAAADAAARNQNFAQYGNMANQDLDLSRMQYGDNLQREQQRQANGLGLIQSGFQNMESRNVYNQAYGPGSPFQQLQQSQVDLAKEAVQTQKAITQNTLNNAARTLAQPTVDPEAEAAKKRSDFVAKLTPELRAQYAAMYPNLKF